MLWQLFQKCKETFYFLHLAKTIISTEVKPSASNFTQGPCWGTIVPQTSCFFYLPPTIDATANHSNPPPQKISESAPDYNIYSAIKNEILYL